MAARVWVIRHGKTKLNQGVGTSVDRIRGWSDIPLDHEGEKEAIELGRKLKGEPIDLILTSDLKRAQETAKVVGRALGAKVVATRAFRPWHLGALTGQPSDEAAPVIADYATNCPKRAVPQGESFVSFRNRFLAGLKMVLGMAAEERRDIGIATHYRGLKLVEGWLKGDQQSAVNLPAFLHYDASERPGSVLLLEWDGQKWQGKMWSKGG